MIRANRILHYIDDCEIDGGGRAKIACNNMLLEKYIHAQTVLDNFVENFVKLC